MELKKKRNSPNRTLPERITTYFTAEERGLIEDAARVDARSLAQQIRVLALEAIEARKKAQSEPAS